MDSQNEKTKAAERLGIPECAELEMPKILRLLRMEFREMESHYRELLKELPISDYEMVCQFYYDQWLYEIGMWLFGLDLDDGQKEQLLEQFAYRRLKIKNKTSAGLHLSKMKEEGEYFAYMFNNFDFRSDSPPAFWKWIGYLTGNSAKRGQGTKYASSFLTFRKYFLFYLSQAIPGTKVNAEMEEQLRTAEKVIKEAFRRSVAYPDILLCMENPLYRQPIQENVRTLVAEYLKELKESRVLLGKCTELEDEEDDMIAAAVLYKNIKDGIVKKENIMSIIPEEAEKLLDAGRLPELLLDDMPLGIEDDEQIYYLENGILYILEEGHVDLKIAKKGILYITCRRIRFEAGDEVYDIAKENLFKTQLFENMPEVIEFIGKEQSLLIQTADTAKTYQMMKKITNLTEQIADRNEMEGLSEKTLMQYLKNADLDTMIFGLRMFEQIEFSDINMEHMREMADVLEKLAEAIKMHPEYQCDIQRFTEYFIPELMKLLWEYRKLSGAGVTGIRMKQLREKICASVAEITNAANCRINSIYQQLLMLSISQADALWRIAGREGASDGSGTLKH